MSHLAPQNNSVAQLRVSNDDIKNQPSDSRLATCEVRAFSDMTSNTAVCEKLQAGWVCLCLQSKLDTCPVNML